MRDTAKYKELFSKVFELKFDMHVRPSELSSVSNTPEAEPVKNFVNVQGIQCTANRPNHGVVMEYLYGKKIDHNSTNDDPEPRTLTISEMVEIYEIFDIVRFVKTEDIKEVHCVLTEFIPYCEAQNISLNRTKNPAIESDVAKMYNLVGALQPMVDIMGVGNFNWGAFNDLFITVTASGDCGTLVKKDQVVKDEPPEPKPESLIPAVPTNIADDLRGIKDNYYSFTDRGKANGTE